MVFSSLHSTSLDLFFCYRVLLTRQSILILLNSLFILSLPSNLVPSYGCLFTLYSFDCINAVKQFSKFTLSFCSKTFFRTLLIHSLVSILFSFQCHIIIFFSGVLCYFDLSLILIKKILWVLVLKEVNPEEKNRMHVVYLGGIKNFDRR